jgi:hypothetical protein
VPEDPAPSDNPDPHTSPLPGAVCLRLSERVDPDAADALWRLVLGGVEADPGGGPSAAGAGTRRAGRHPGQAEGVDQAGDDDPA